MSAGQNLGGNVATNLDVDRVSAGRIRLGRRIDRHHADAMRPGSQPQRVDTVGVRRCRLFVGVLLLIVIGVVIDRHARAPGLAVVPRSVSVGIVEDDPFYFTVTKHGLEVTNCEPVASGKSVKAPPAFVFVKLLTKLVYEPFSSWLAAVVNRSSEPGQRPGRGQRR